jgi:hypothetical protein
MILPDHNAPQHAVQRLRRRGIRVLQVGADIRRPEWDEQQEILPRKFHGAVHPLVRGHERLDKSLVEFALHVRQSWKQPPKAKLRAE